MGDQESGNKKDNSIIIIVNGREKVPAKEDMTFNEIVALAEGLPSGQFIVYTVTYRRGCSAPGFLDSGLTVFASMLPRPARRSHVAPERGFDSGTSLASTARCTSA